VPRGVSGEQVDGQTPAVDQNRAQRCRGHAQVPRGADLVALVPVPGVTVLLLPTGLAVLLLQAAMNMSEAVAANSRRLNVGRDMATSLVGCLGESSQWTTWETDSGSRRFIAGSTSTSTYLRGVGHSRQSIVHATGFVASPACGALIRRGTRTSNLTRGAANQDVRATAAEG
jgi:hypothetical protein